MAVASLFISISAIAISILALWKTHFAPFSAIAVAGQLTLRIYPIRSGDSRWFIASLNVPVSVTNEGARPGVVRGLRLRLHFPKIPIPGNCEFIGATWEIPHEKAPQITKNRFKWVHSIVVGHWMPFSVLPKATVTKHLVFEARWEDPVIQELVECTLQSRTGSSDWQDVTNWTLHLGADVWGELVNRGTSMTYDTLSPNEGNDECVPADLHKYTGSKDAIPKDGFGAHSSHLDYPERR